MATTAAIDLDAMARIGKALADPTRRRMLVELLGGPHYAGELAALVDSGLANTSNHLACLRDCGIVVDHSEGRHVRYELANPDLADALRLLANLDLTATCDCHR